MIRFATVGTSVITDWFVKACSLTGRYELAAVYSRSRETGEKFASAHGCGRVFCSLEEMARSSSFDAVYIASPNVLHVPQSRLFLQNGKHVICEKPAVTSAAEFAELRALARKNGLVYLEAMPPRHAASRTAVREAVGGLGRISLARLDYCQRSSRLDRFRRGEHVNIFDMSLAEGTLMDLGVYCVSAAVDFFGMPNAVSASASFLENGADGCGTALFTYDRFPAVLTYSKTGESGLGSEIIGEDGTLVIRTISQYADVFLRKNGTETQIAGAPTRDVLMSGEAARFADYISFPEENRADYEAALRLSEQTHACMDRMKQSAEIKYDTGRNSSL